MNTAVFDDLYTQFGSDLEKHFEQINWNDYKKAIWLFQYYERYGTSLNSGSIVDYRQYAAKYLNDSGELLDCLGDLSSHEQAAVNKFREAEKADLKSISPNIAKTNAKGDNQS